MGNYPDDHPVFVKVRNNHDAVMAEHINAVSDQLDRVIEFLGLKPDFPPIDNDPKNDATVGERMSSLSSGKVPIGTVVAFASTDPAHIPSGWLVCDGRSFSQTDYPVLYAILNSTHTPDLRSTFIRGWSSLSGQENALHARGGSRVDLPQHKHVVTVSTDGVHDHSLAILNQKTENNLNNVTLSPSSHTNSLGTFESRLWMWHHSKSPYPSNNNWPSEATWRKSDDALSLNRFHSGPTTYAVKRGSVPANPGVGDSFYWTTPAGGWRTGTQAAANVGDAQNHDGRDGKHTHAVGVSNTGELTPKALPDWYALAYIIRGR